MRVKHLWLVLALIAGMHWGGAALVWAQTTSRNHHANDRMPERLKLPPYATNQILFKLKTTPTDQTESDNAAVDRMLQNLSVTHKLKRVSPLFRRLGAKARRPKGHRARRVLLERIFKAELPPEVLPLQAVKQLEANPAVEWAEPNHFYYTQEKTPDDPSFPEQWHLAAINAPAAWDVTTGSSDVVIAIIDTGVDWHHPDLAANIWTNTGEIEADGIDNDNNGFIDDIRGWDFVNADPSQVPSGEDPGPPDNDPMDFYGHGTHVAGIAGAVGNNNVGVTGVNWDVSLMPLRAGFAKLVGFGYSGVLLDEDVAAALVYAADNGANIVNMSFGGAYPSRTLRTAIDYCHEAGVLLVAAAGNNGSDQPSYPAAFDHVFSVASLSQINHRSIFSNYGQWVDAAAPGESIYSTTVGGGYGYKLGTSMAAPVIAGVAGLVKAAHPAWNAEQIGRQLRATTVNLNADHPDFHNLLGAGLVAAGQAVSQTTSPERLGIARLWLQETELPSDGWFDPGELLAVRPSVRNFTSAQSGISVSLSTDDPYVSILKNFSLLGDMTANVTATNWDDPFLIYIDANVPRGHTASLTLEISTSDSNPAVAETIAVPLNRVLGEPQLFAQYAGYDVRIFATPTGEATVLYRLGDGVYARTGDTKGNWMPPMRISDVSGVDTVQSYVATTDDAGRIHLVFKGVAAGSQVLFYTQRDPAGGTWYAPEQIPVNTGNISLGTIAADSQGRVHVIWRNSQYPNGFLYTVYDGWNWSSEMLVETAPPSPWQMKLLFESNGDGYLLLGYDEQIFFMKLTESTWGPPQLVATISTNEITFSAGLDSGDRLHMVYSGFAYNDAVYRSYDGRTWSDELILLEKHEHNTYARPMIAVGADDFLYVARQTRLRDADAIKIYTTTHDGTTWSAWTPATFFERAGVRKWFGHPPLGFDFTVDEFGTYLLLEADEGNLSFFTSDRDPSLLPSRPNVSDGGSITADPFTLSASWSSEHPDGIAEYQYAIGTAPGEGDLRYWTSAGTATGTTVDLTDTPLIPGQTYFFSVRALGNSALWSPVGTSDGIMLTPENELVAIVHVSTAKNYLLTTAQTGAEPYIDRNYTITSLPEFLQGAVLVQTANADKLVNSEDHLGLKFFQDADVYLCYDRRGVNPPPMWLQSWQQTGATVSTTDSSASPMTVFRTHAAAGDITFLPGNHFEGATGAQSNYFVIARPKQQSDLVEITYVSSDKAYTTTAADLAARPYIDRSYEINQLSDGLQGWVLVRTANEDKHVALAPHLGLRMTKDAIAYVAYDRRGADHPPCWLEGWQSSHQQVNTTDASASPMVLFSRCVSTDTEIFLGGNQYCGGEAAESNYFVLVQPVSAVLEIGQVSSGKPYELVCADVGMKPYIDRSYTISNLDGVTPNHGLGGGILIRTANDDKAITAEAHLEIDVYQAVDVFACYDRRANDLPNWLQTWQPFETAVATTDSEASPMDVYQQYYGPRNVWLGGNHDGGDTGARSNYFVIVQP